MHSMDNLKKLLRFGKLAPEATNAFWGYDKAALADGTIPKKYKELMAIAVALTTQCVYCIDVHTRSAKKVGCSREEVAETVLLAAALRAGGAAAHGALALKIYDQA